MRLQDKKVVLYWAMPKNTNTLVPGESLNMDEMLNSNSNQFFLVYQNDGNLVIYDRTVIPNKVLWSTQTQGHVPGHVAMQPDGNLVIYNIADQGVWQTGTFLPTRKGTNLVLQDDGNLVLYGLTSLFSSFSDGSMSPQPTIAPGPQGGNGVSLNSVVQAAQAAETIVTIVASLL